MPSWSRITYFALCTLRKIRRLGSEHASQPSELRLPKSATVFICDPHSADDAHTLRCLKSAEEMHYAVSDFDQWLRSEVKHNGREEFQVVRETLHNFLLDNGVTLDD